MQNPPQPRHQANGRRWLPICALAVIAAIALPAAAPARTAHTTSPAGTASRARTASAARFKITPVIANHTPIVGKNWPVELKVTRGKQKLNGTVVYQFMFEGAVVSTQPTHGSYKFTKGVYRDKMVFPAQSLGQPLTLRFVVKTKYGTRHLDWAIRTKTGTSTTSTTTTT